MDVRVRRALGGVAIVLAVWLLLAVVQLWRVSGDLQEARDRTQAAQESLGGGDIAGASADLEEAAAGFARAHRRLGGLAILPLRGLPVAARHVRVLRHLSSSGAAAAQAAEVLTDAVAALPGGAAALAPTDGGLPVETFAALVGPVRHADALLARSLRELELTAGVPVIDRVAEARRQAQEVLPAAAAAVHRSAAILPVLDQFLGADRPRRYLFLAQNPAEIRGTGGFIGAYSILTLDQGRFSFDDFQEIQELPAYPAEDVVPPSAEFAERYNQYGGAGFWHNINMTPDFPSAARAMENLYAHGTGDTVDGVIAVDPFALQALLKLAGPVDVPGFGTVEADDVVDVVSNRAHDEIADSEARKQLLGAVALHAFQGFLRGGGKDHAVEAAQTLVDVMREGHLLLRSADPQVQAALLTAGVAGALHDPPGDYAAVIANAGSAAKLDYYVDRTVTYDVTLNADGSLTATLDAAFANQAPTSGISARVIGPNARGLDAGEQRLVVSLYGPDDAAVEAFSRTRGDRPVLVGRELGHAVFDTVMEIPAGQTQSLTVSWTQADGWERNTDGGHYRLTMQGQPTLRPTTVEVRINPPPGLSVAATGHDPQRNADGTVTYRGELEALLEIDIALRRAGADTWWEKLRRWWSQPVLSRGDAFLRV